jgi:branched-chain amino acid transport system substrate-binding protein
VSARPASAARIRGPLVAALLAVGVAVTLAGCGTREVAGDRIRGQVLTIYSSLPLQGASAFGGRAVLDGERLALAQVHSRIGPFAVVLKALDDATVARGGWDPGQVTQNAHIVLQDPSALAYVGEFNSGASAIAIPLLNRTGMLVLSPTSTAIGLTTAAADDSPGEPDKYYPTGKRTFVRLAPDDSLQAAAQVRLQRRLGCRATYVLNDGEFDGDDIAVAFQLAARAAGLRVAGAQSFDPRAQDYASLALTVSQSGANCVLIGALPENHAALVARQVGAALPGAMLFGTSALAQPSFTDPDHGGVPPELDSRVFITAPAARPGLAARFDTAFAARFGPPGAYAVYGYEAMRLVLAAIARATDGGRHTARRSAVLEDILGKASAGGPLGSFEVKHDGTATLHTYGVFALSGGSLVLLYEVP